jgi:hypothetical protein
MKVKANAVGITLRGSEGLLEPQVMPQIIGVEISIGMAFETTKFTRIMKLEAFTDFYFVL